MNGTWSLQVARSCVSLVTAGILGLAMSSSVSATPVTYGQWSTAWWEWAEQYFPDLDFGKGRVDCSLGQSGPVWFLGGSGDDRPVSRRCTIERGKALFIPLVNAADFDDEPSCAADPCTVEEQREILNGIFSEAPAGIFNSVACGLEIEVDEAPAVFSTPIVRTQSPPFDYAGNLDNISDGFWVMVEPLPEGDHTIQFSGGICDIDTGDPLFAVDVKYVITVE